MTEVHTRVITSCRDVSRTHCFAHRALCKLPVAQILRVRLETRDYHQTLPPVQEVGNWSEERFLNSGGIVREYRYCQKSNENSKADQCR